MKKIIGDTLALDDGAVLPLSRAVAAGGFIFVSGQLGVGGDAKLVAGGIREQTHQALVNLGAILKEAGATLSDVVKVTGWLANEEAFPAFNETYGSFFNIRPPARSMVVSRLLVPGALVELEAMAIL